MAIFRVFIGLFIFFQFANAANFTYPDFKQCYTKNVKSFVYFGDIRAVAISKHLAVAYSKTTPKMPFVKFDPFLNLYLFHSKKPLKPVRLKSTHMLKLGEWIAGMDEDSLYAGNFAKSGDLLDSLYIHNADVSENSIISCLCCEVYGLGVGDGSFIGSEYIKRFIKEKNIYYGDIGVRFAKKGKDFVVKSKDPFYQNQLLHVGDVIKKINGKKITSLKQLNQTVLFSKPKTILSIEVKRDKFYTLKRSAMVKARSGGGNLSDSFLEKKGIFLDKEMKIKRIVKKSFGEISGLKIGDKFLQIDQMDITTVSDLQEYFSNTKKKEVHLLLDRNDFQFFIKLKL